MFTIRCSIKCAFFSTIVATCFCFLMCCATAWANPNPEGAIFVHVQPVLPDMCANSTIGSCSEINQYSEDSGVLEFDLFFVNGIGEEPVTGIEYDVNWPSDWSLVDYEICAGGGYFYDYYQGGQFLVWPEGVDDQFFLVARLILNAPTYGRLSGYGTFEINGSGGYWLAGVVARAGRECGTCTVPCDTWDFCYPWLTPGTLDVEVEAGEVTTVELTGGAEDADGPCPVTFGGTETWMSVEAEENFPGDYTLTVTVDAGDLTPGAYTGWVTADISDCSHCSLVRLLVTETTPVHERTWGAIKQLYR